MPRPHDLPPNDSWPHGTRYRYVGGCRCEPCRAANSNYNRLRARAIKQGRGNPLVSAHRAQAHMLTLSALGIGRRSVAKHARVGLTTLLELRTGRKRLLRKHTEERILAVPLTLQHGAMLVPAGPTWQRVAFLRLHGWTKVKIARAIGQHTDALQLRGDTVTLRNARKVHQLYISEWLRQYRPVPIQRIFP